MDQQLLSYYNRELQYIREMGGEFAKEFPKVAGRLGLDGFECADPYVERLLEGFAFLAARVQLKHDAEFPKFTQHLLEIVYPHYLAPIPSMAVVQFAPDLTEGSLDEGFVVPRETTMRSRIGKGDQTACLYRTAHETTLWPLEIAEVEYTGRDVATVTLPAGLPDDVTAVLRIRLRVAPGHRFQELAIDKLPIFIRGGEERSSHLYEQIFSAGVGVVYRSGGAASNWHVVADASQIRRVGFDDEQSLLPFGPRSFQGYRLLQEYFAFHQRFLFFELNGIRTAAARCEGDELDVLILLNRADPTLDHSVGKSDVALFCTPAINLFPQRADRIHLNQRDHEHHVVPDRTRPMDIEVYQVNRVVGIGQDADTRRRFQPFYSSSDLAREDEGQAFYTLRRTPRLLSARQKRLGPRSSYLGSEVYLALVDSREAPLRHDLEQIEVETLCTNRDLPLHVPIGLGNTDFTLDVAAPVLSIRCLAGPTEPKPSLSSLSGEMAWRLISHLSLNYLSIVNNAENGRAAGLQDLLRLYSDPHDASQQKQIESIVSVQSDPVTRRLPMSGPITFGRGLEITVKCDESGFEGFGVYLLGAVLSQFFARHVAINSFTETVLRTTERGEIARWPALVGRRKIL